MQSQERYEARKFELSGLQGISDRTLGVHFKLYEGYVAEANRIQKVLAGILQDGRVDPGEAPGFAELKRHFAFEYNEMVLHELYFGNLKSGGGGVPPRQSAFQRAAESAFGSYEAWQADFVATAKIRGVGWSLCCQDPATRVLSNHWVTLHEGGVLAGLTPVLVLDVWEHAYLLDYAPAEKARYIEAFFANVDWEAVDRRVVREEGVRLKRVS